MENLDAGHKQRCRNFFLIRYQARKNLRCPTPHPIPSSDSQSVDPLLPYLLNDKEFYQGRIYASGTPPSTREFNLGALLWGALGMAPHNFMVLCDVLVNPKGLFWRTYLARAPPQNRRFSPPPSLYELAVEMQSWPPVDQEIGFDNIVSALRSYSMTLTQLGFDDFWFFKPPRHNELYPLEFGLMIYIEEEWSKLAWVYLDAAISTMPEMAHLDKDAPNSAFISRIRDDKIYDPDERRKTTRAVHVLFAAAGTGKTRQIFQLLQRHWGFYMLPLNLEPTPAVPLDENEQQGIDILGPQRYAVSRDTYTLFEQHPQIYPNWRSHEVNVFLPVIVSRVALLYEFLRRHPQAKPTEWLWLQISCASVDPFDALCRLFRLVDPQYLDMDSNVMIDAEIPGHLVPKCYALLQDRFLQPSGIPLCYCIDEVQTTLDNPQASAMFGHMYDALTVFYALSKDDFGRTADAFNESDISSEGGPWRMSDKMPDIDPILVISGTSLNLEKLEENLATYLTETWGADEPPVRKWEAYLVHDMFPLVSSDEEFWRLYQHQLDNIIAESWRNQGSLNVDSASSLPLLSRSGRPLLLPNSNHGLDAVQLRKWLWRPVEIAPLSEMIQPLGQICRLAMDQEPRQPQHKDRHLFAGLLEALDHADSDQIASELALQIGHVLSHGDPQREPLCKQVLRVLADVYNSNTDDVSRMVQNEATNSRAPDGNFRELANAFHQHLRDIYTRNLIVSNSVSHRGRYRWSTIYIEEFMSLSRHLAGSSSMAEIRSAVEQARKKTHETAVEVLKSQIRKMKASDKTKLLDELFRAAIRAEMISIPTIFLEQRYAQLVTYGFASTQRDGQTVKYTLAEPIAVHAIMDYLRTEGGEDYGKLMLQWLVNTQEDHEVQAMFGKATEWFIAMSLDHMIRHKPVEDSNLPDLLNTSTRREALLRLFAESVSIRPQQSEMSKLKSVIWVEDLGLPESPIVYKYHTPNSIWDWMRHYRTEGQNSTSAFMFPDAKAGPDLMFILENQSLAKNEGGQHGSTQVPFRPEDKVLVAAQIKTGRSAKFEAAMETLLDSNWHGNMGKAASDDELAHWEGAQFLLLLVCTGITVKQDKVDEWMRNNSGRITNGRFFCVIDETVTSDVLEQDFVALADAIKTNKFEQHVSKDVQKRGGKRVIHNHGDGTVGTRIPDRSRKRARNNQ